VRRLLGFFEDIVLNLTVNTDPFSALAQRRVLGKHTETGLTKYRSLHINAILFLIFYFSCYLLFGMYAIVTEKTILMGSFLT